MQNQTLITVIPAIIAAITTYYVAYKNIFSPLKIEIANKQLYNVYLPLFLFLEPHLYREVDLEIINEFLRLFKTIKENNYELIDSDLLNEVFILEKSLKNNSYNYDSFNILCSTIDRLFEKKRKILSLPTRKFMYKVNTRQINKSTKEFLSFTSDIFLDATVKFVTFFVPAVFFYCIWLLFSQLFLFLKSLI